MPGTNAGTGYPLTFRCAKCKSKRHKRSTNYIATGRVRPISKSRYSRHIGSRQTNRMLEYKCLTCGHVGWSQHSDMERAYKCKTKK